MGLFNGFFVLVAYPRKTDSLPISPLSQIFLYEKVKETNSYIRRLLNHLPMKKWTRMMKLGNDCYLMLRLDEKVNATHFMTLNVFVGQPNKSIPAPLTTFFFSQYYKGNEQTNIISSDNDIKDALLEMNPKNALFNVGFNKIANQAYLTFEELDIKITNFQPQETSFSLLQTENAIFAVAGIVEYCGAMFYLIVFPRSTIEFLVDKDNSLILFPCAVNYLDSPNCIISKNRIQNSIDYYNAKFEEIKYKISWTLKIVKSPIIFINDKYGSCSKMKKENRVLKWNECVTNQSKSVSKANSNLLLKSDFFEFQPLDSTTSTNKKSYNRYKHTTPGKNRLLQVFTNFLKVCADKKCTVSSSSRYVMELGLYSKFPTAFGLSIQPKAILAAFETLQDEDMRVYLLFKLLQSHAFNIKCFERITEGVVKKVSVDLDQGTAKLQLQYLSENKDSDITDTGDEIFLKRMSLLIYLLVWLDEEQINSDYVEKPLHELEKICSLKELEEREKSPGLPSIQYMASSNIIVS